MADGKVEKNNVGLETQKQVKPHWDKMDKDELILQVKKQLMLLQKMKLKCDDFGKKNAGLETAIQEKEKDNEELKVHLDSVILQKNDGCSRVSVLEDENANLNRKIMNLEEQIDCMTMKQETANTTFQCLQDGIKEMQDKNNDLSMEIILLNAARDEALGSMKTLKETLATETRKELDAAMEELALAQEGKSKIQEELNCLIEDFETSEKLLNVTKSEYMKLEGKYAELQHQWEALDQEYSVSKTNLAKLENDLSECNNSLEKAMTEKKGMMKKLGDINEIQKKNKALKTNSDSQQEALIAAAKVELENLKQELRAYVTDGESLTQKINDAELIKETLQKNHLELKTEHQQLNEKYLDSVEKLKDVNIALLESRQREEEMSNKIENLALALENCSQLEYQVQELKNNESSLIQTIEAQQGTLEEVRQLALILNSQNFHVKGMDDRKDSCTSKNILTLLKECASHMHNDANEHEMSEQVNTVLDEKISNVEMHNTGIRQKIESLQCLLKSLDGKVGILESVMAIEKITVECQTETPELTSKCVSTESLVEMVDVVTEVSELIETCTIECQTTMIPRPDFSSVCIGTELVKTSESFTQVFDSDASCIPRDVREVQATEKKDASTETCQVLMEKAVAMVDACSKSSKELLPAGTERRNWIVEKEAYDVTLLDYTKQLRREKLSIEQSLRTILQCITETELDDNENSDINASLSLLKLLLDGISESASKTDEDQGFSDEIAHLCQISEVVTLFEGVLLLKIQKWSTCFQTLNAALTGIEGRCMDLQKIVGDKEKSLKVAEELVSKYKSIAIKVKKEAAELKKKVMDVGLELDKTVSEREHYKSQVERTSSQLGVLNKEKSAADDTAKVCETHLAQEKEKHKQTLSKLELALKEANRSNLMSLEFADYERLIADLNKQMELKNSEVSKLQKEMEFHKEKIQGFQIQIEQLESQKEQSEVRAEQLKNLSVKLKGEIAELRKLEGEWMATESSLMVRLESLSRDVENYKIQIADVATDNQKLQYSKESAQDAHQKAVRILENRLTLLMDELQRVKNEYASCQMEYENYKVRAHSVLKHKKSKPGTSDSGATRAGTQFDDVNLEEKQRLEKAVEVLQGRVQELVAHLTVTRTELDTLQEEHDNLLHRHNNLALSQNEQDMSWKQRVERLQKELMNERQEHANTVRNLQQQQQLSLNNSLKLQMDALCEEHKQQLEELQLKLDVSNDEIVRLQKEVTEVRMATSAALTRDDDLMVDFLNTERQEGEGSEFTDNVFGTPQKISTAGTIGFVPFDQLLNQDKFSISSIGTAEVEKLEGQLSVAAKRVEHLTEILHESEATNARMTEQTRVLKEEIRRLERNQEREQHLANMEYVKNIIVKFFSLPSGDERERLVPVLTTILRLSPDEEHQVQVIAKGGVLDAQAASGWSSYLPIWPRT